MRPPICALCDRGLDTEVECETVAFTMTPEDIAVKNRMGREDVFLTYHPPHIEWFCLEHAPLAKQLVHLSCDEAVRQLIAALRMSQDAI